jgi:DNA-binding transcriptional LysR family regulator
VKTAGVPQLDPRRLLTLRAVSLHGGVQGAAAALHLTPSAISQQLHQLERQCGVALFDRTARTVGLTPAGRTLLASAEQIDAALQAADGALRDRRDRVEGRIVVGSFQTAIVFLLAPAISALRDAHPALDVEVLELPDADGTRLVRSGELDAATVERPLGRSAAHRRLGAVPLIDDPFVVIVPRSWRQRSVAALVDARWIASPGGVSATDDALAALFRSLGARARIVHRCVEYPPVIELVARGEGAAIVPTLALRLTGEARVRTLALASPAGRTISLVHRRSAREPSAAVRALIDALALALAEGVRT